MTWPTRGPNGSKRDEMAEPNRRRKPPTSAWRDTSRQVSPFTATPVGTPWRFKSSHPHSQTGRRFVGLDVAQTCAKAR